MMNFNFISTFVPPLKEHYDNDLIDKANFFYTPMLLIIFYIVLTVRSLVGESIECSMTGQFPIARQEYIDDYCFMLNTYYMKPHEGLQSSLLEIQAREIDYCQSVPFFLGLEAILFYLPQLIWRTFKCRTGISIRKVVMSTARAAKDGEAARAKVVENIATHIYQSLQIETKHNDHNSFTMAASRDRGLTSLYLRVKSLYVVQAIIQLFILNRFLSADNLFWGLQIFRDLIDGRGWQENGLFPQVTLCDFEVSTIDDKQTVQCALKMNMYNEMVFTFIWFWLVLLPIGTIVNHIMWTIQMGNTRFHVLFLKKYLRASKVINDGDERKIATFAEDGLGDDGMLTMRLISGHIHDRITAEIIGKLWELHFPNEHGKDGTQKMENAPSSEYKGNDGHQSTETLQKTMKNVQDVLTENNCNTEEIMNVNDNNSSAVGQQKIKAADVSDKNEQ